MDEYKELSARVNADRIVDILESDGSFRSKYKDNSNVKLLGIISRLEKKTTKNNTTMCFVELEDLTAGIECLVFSKLFADRANLLQMGNIVMIRGRLSLREDKEPTVVCENIEPNPVNIYKSNPDDKQVKQRKGLFLRLESENSTATRKIELLTEIFDGTFPVYCYYNDTKEYKRTGLIDINGAVLEELNNILGEKNVVLRK